MSLFRKKTNIKRTSKKQVISKQKNTNSTSKKNQVRAGEVWFVNDKKTSGHKSIITKRTKTDYDKVEHIPITESDSTYGKKNIRLQENPEKGSTMKSHILSKVQKSKVKNLGSKQDDVIVKNPIDKSIIRHIKNERKRNKKISNKKRA